MTGLGNTKPSHIKLGINNCRAKPIANSIVFDTNVILSAFITQGLSHRVFDICIDKHHLYISPWIIKEINDKLRNKFKVPNKELKRIKNFLPAAFSNLIPNGRT